MHKLWRGERVSHQGKLGDFPYLHMKDGMSADIPLMFVGFGIKSLEMAGGLFDGVILHTFLSDDALQRSVRAVRRGRKSLVVTRRRLRCGVYWQRLAMTMTKWCCAKLLREWRPICRRRAMASCYLLAMSGIRNC